jgi:hypothetical protein
MNGLKKWLLTLLVIDEVSMLLICWRYGLHDANSWKKRPFGGVQVLYWDLLQLPPVIRDEEWRTLRNYYKGSFTHVSATKSAAVYRIVNIFRQTDTEFISVLNNLRDNKIITAMLAALNKYVQPDLT